MSKKTKIRSTVDFAAEGKHHGYLVIPHSRDQSAWGSIELPVSVIKNGDGPTVLFTGANHGDEYEGPIALVKLRAALEAEQINGRVIIVPALNLPAFRVAGRSSPIDGRNMNRVFPGRPDGSISEMIADFVSTEILPLCDVVIDFHSGGKSLYFAPTSIIHDVPDADLKARTMAALMAFGAPLGLVLTELDNLGMLDTTVEEMGKVFVSTELGGGGGTTPETVAIAERGACNVLRHFGILAGAPEGETRLMHTPGDSYIAAGDDGLFEFMVDVGDTVQAGAPLAAIHYLEHADRPPLIHTAPKSGMVIGRHAPGLITKGDFVALIGEDYESQI